MLTHIRDKSQFYHLLNTKAIHFLRLFLLLCIFNDKLTIKKFCFGRTQTSDICQSASTTALRVVPNRSLQISLVNGKAVSCEGSLS